MVAIQTHNVLTVARTEALEASVRKGVIHMVALVVGTVASIPVIIADMRRGINAALLAWLALWPYRLRVSRLRRRGNPPLVRAWLVIRLALRLLRVLGRFG